MTPLIAGRDAEANRRPVPVTPEERAQMVQPEDCADLMLFLARLPAHVCINEIVVSPTHNRGYVGIMQAREAAREMAADYTRRAPQATPREFARYLSAVASGQPRHDLAGQPVEDVAPEQLHHALVEVFRRRQGRS